MPIVRREKIPMADMDPEVRKASFDEVALGYTPAQAIAEAKRCLLCQVPVCEDHCPVNVPIREFLKLIGEGKFLE